LRSSQYRNCRNPSKQFNVLWIFFSLYSSRPKAKLRSLLIRELAHLLPHPYWQTRLTSPFSKGETGLGTLATFFPPHSCPSHELRGSVDVKASHYAASGITFDFAKISFADALL
jgi:hypothetical protein